MDSNIDKPEDLFKILGIENLDIEVLKTDIYNMLEEANTLSNGTRDKSENNNIDKLLEDVKKTDDLNEILHHYIFIKWVLSTVKSKLKITPDARKQSQIMSKIYRRFSNSEKIAEFLNESQNVQKDEKEDENTLTGLREDFDIEPPEWDLSRYAYKGQEMDYDVRFRVRIYPKMKVLIKPRKKEIISAFEVGDFTVGRDTKDGNSKLKSRRYKMLSVVNRDDVYMIVGKFDEDDIRENLEFYKRNLFSKWNLKNADENNFGFPGKVVLDENGKRKVIFNIPGCEDLIESLSIARKQYPEIFCSFNKKTRNKKKTPRAPSTPGAQDDEGGR